MPGAVVELGVEDSVLSYQEGYDEAIDDGFVVEERRGFVEIVVGSDRVEQRHGMCMPRMNCRMRGSRSSVDAEEAPAQGTAVFVPVGRFFSDCQSLGQVCTMKMQERYRAAGEIRSKFEIGKIQDESRKGTDNITNQKGRARLRTFELKVYFTMFPPTHQPTRLCDSHVLRPNSTAPKR